MKAILSALALAMALSASPVGAGPFEHVTAVTARDEGVLDQTRQRPALLSERGVERIVYREGYVEIADVRLRQGAYLVEAVRPNGAVFDLALDARDGTLIRSERVGWARGDDRPRGPVRQSGAEFRFDF